MTRTNRHEPDLIELRRLICEEGFTPWLAAKDVIARGLTSRSQSTLFYQGQRMDRHTTANVAFDGGEAVRIIATGGDVLVPARHAAALTAELEAVGIAYDRRTRRAVQFCCRRPEVG